MSYQPRLLLNFLNCHFDVLLVSQKWMAIVMSLDLFKLRKMFGTIEELLYLLTKVEEDKLVWHALDPFSRE